MGARKPFHVQLHINCTYNEIIKPMYFWNKRNRYIDEKHLVSYELYIHWHNWIRYVFRFRMETFYDTHFGRAILHFISTMTTFQVYFYFSHLRKKSPICSPFISVFLTFCKNRRMNRRKGANFNSRKRIHECDHCGLEFKTKYRAATP